MSNGSQSLDMFEWIDALQPAAAILGPGCAWFFIFVVLLGKYLLINLLIAVILHEFQDGGKSTSGPLSDRSGCDSRRHASDFRGRHSPFRGTLAELWFAGQRTHAQHAHVL